MATYPLTLGTLLIMLLIAAAALAWGMRTKTPFAWMSHRATIAFLPLSAMVVPVAVVEAVPVVERFPDRTRIEWSKRGRL